MTEFVFIDSWQMQCCGEVFSLGSRISFAVEENDDPASLVDALGSEWAQRLTYHEDHHDTARGPTSTLQGIVTSIVAVTHDLEAVPGEPRGSYRPAPGTQAFHSVESIDKWEFEPKSREAATSSGFGGWIVGLLVDQ